MASAGAISSHHISFVAFALGLTAVAAFVSLGVAAYAWRRRSTPGAVALSVLSLASGWWSFGYFVELVATDLSTKLLVANLEWAGVLAAPVAWFVFASNYSGRDRYTSTPSVLAASFLPMVAFVAVWTNPAHHLMWTSVTAEPAANGNITILQTEWGPLYWVMLGYGYLLWLAGATILVRTAFDMPTIYRLQAVTLVVGALMPILGNFATTLLELEGASFDMTPASFTFAGLACAVALNRYGLLESRPVPRWMARDRVVQTMADAMLVTDTKWRVTDLNEAAQTVFEHHVERLKGRTVGDIVPEFSPLRAERGPQTISFDNSQRYYELFTSDFTDTQGRTIGHAVIFRDVTDKRHNLQQLEVMNRVLRHNLRTEANLLDGYTGLVFDDLEEGDIDAARSHADVVRSHANILVNISEKARKLGELRDADGEVDEARNSPATIQIQNAAATVESDYPEATIRFDSLPSGDVVCPPLFESIVVELIENGVEHTDAADPVVTISGSVENGTLELHVVDDGPGIAQSELAAIEADGETPLRHGSGLGLWLVTWGADQLRGDVSFERRPEGGTDAVVRIPIRRNRVDETVSDATHEKNGPDEAV
ncbi:PAS domain-containing protein [Haloferax sp. MBLA0076]|uniref:histidine kinase n=1 Tax=Haloferax litoreum TaxID=2666140 RepID=A0A6A8GC02_9EURY|nr:MULTISPECIES: histidine kinase N-terminal 7TM domain-containing protein [Haloferax]KAB1194774.1 PAS domain-containing protein [Haloferax sp. CBA1148]MRX20784.1 PAS domain-containing protein [Haloferax litoreum]